MATEESTTEPASTETVLACPDCDRASVQHASRDTYRCEVCNETFTEPVERERRGPSRLRGDSLASALDAADPDDIRPDGGTPPGDDPFDYGDRQDDGQYERHPTVDDGEFVQPVRESYVHDACDGTTTMGRHLAESWARSPSYYTETFCAACQDYYPVGEFVWADTDIRLGDTGGDAGGE